MSDPAVPPDSALYGLPVSADPENFRAREPLEVLVTRFSDAVRRGEQPSIEEYAQRYADWADQIRELFPLIQTLEHWKTDKEMECLRRSVPQEFPVRRLGDYRIIRELGRGGMGIVFEAVHNDSGQRVAIKLLPWRFAADMDRWEDQFRREAKTIAGLRHANIVEVHSFGIHEGYCYYVMDLIAGVSLDWIIRRLRESADLVFVDEIRRAGRDLCDAVTVKAANRSACGLRRDSWIEFANVALQVALALAHAHEAGVLHNDVKPANLLLDGTGNVVVTDFGIGRRSTIDAEQADEHQVGTLRYMAPERLRGQFDTCSDVYSLGATLYELVTQKPAFAAEDRRQLVERILKSESVSPRQLAPLVPRPLETIIVNAMQADPVDRYPSAAAMASDLLRYVNHLPVVDRRPGVLNRALRWVSRRP